MKLPPLQPGGRLEAAHPGTPSLGPLKLDPTPPEAQDVAEIGDSKTVTQHVGNIGFGMATVAMAGTQLGNLLKTSLVPAKVMLVAPAIHLGVVAVEGYNSLTKLKQGEHAVAASSGGNAIGCLSGFLESSAGLAAMSKHAGLGVGMALAGGGLGIVAGAIETRQGLKNVKAGGSKRTLVMGGLDLASGVVSLTGAGLLAKGIGPLGTALMFTASMVDLSGIAADYLGKKS